MAESKLEFDFQMLRRRIIQKFGTIERFADALGISMASMSKKLNNKVYIGPDEIVRWSNLLDIEIENVPVYFLTEKSKKLNTRESCEDGN